MSDAAQKPPRMTVDEFIIWSQMRPGRFELLDGEVVTMQSERIGHARAKGRVYRLFSALLERAGSDCVALPDGVAVKVDHDTVYEPDCLIHCGPLDDASAFAAEPVVVVEVLSRSTQAIDTGKKFFGYFRIPSLQHYLVIDADKRILVHHQRNGDRIASTILGGGIWHGDSTLDLEPPGITIPVAELFVDLQHPVDET